ncbi:type II secretion system protein GspL [Pseudomonas sp. GD03858]|uniref:PilN domain-containing protein n=1 Tax=unclassified Pseudomonas TaxID=196821 RepID=UPI00244AC9E7|nr:MULTISPECIES: PilN domain-containing protein [unclassified Pseudomonas]MDH0648597.1 type II secretion system protein GspL [Pseudomonas sp. GD03867]MDH0664604.1 type II secretion system protein GspL [Pseudomonas sp. GD03858]
MNMSRIAAVGLSGAAARWRRAATNFMRWWRGELLACLPANWRHAWLARGRVNTLCWPLADGAPLPSGQPVTLLLAPQLALVCALQLPRQPRRVLRKVMAYELDKLTPYTAQQACFDIVVGDDAQHLVLVERLRLEAILQRLEAEGVQVLRVDVQDEAGAARGLDLVPDGCHARAARRQRAWRGGLLAVIAILLIACQQAWIDHRERALELRREQLAELRTRALQVDGMRKQLQSRQALERALQLQAAQRLSSAAMLDLLSRCLPQDSWLEHLQLAEDGSLSLSGGSPRASALPAVLGECAGLGKVTFKGGIQADAETGLEHFTLQARRPEGEDR